MTLSTLYLLCRWVHFIAVMQLTGCAFYTTLLLTPAGKEPLSIRFHPLLRSSSWLALASALALLTVQVGLMSGDWHNISDSATWLAVLHTEFGTRWCWQIVLALFACLVFSLRGKYRHWLLLISGMSQLCGMALVGHAAMLEGWIGLLQRISQSVHLIAAAFWAGGLLPLLLLMADAQSITKRAEAIRAMMRFSRYGHLAVVLVIISGMINSWIILGWPLIHFSLYSRLLLVKILLVGVMVLIALVNRYWLVPHFRLAGSQAQIKFVRMTQLELAIAIIVLLLVSFFATQAPT